MIDTRAVALSITIQLAADPRQGLRIICGNTTIQKRWPRLRP